MGIGSLKRNLEKGFFFWWLKALVNDIYSSSCVCGIKKIFFYHRYVIRIKTRISVGCKEHECEMQKYVKLPTALHIIFSHRKIPLTCQVKLNLKSQWDNFAKIAF